MLVIVQIPSSTRPNRREKLRYFKSPPFPISIDAGSGLLDIARLGDMLTRVRHRIVTRRLDRVSPLAVPVMLEIGREAVYGEASDALLAEAAEELVKEATGQEEME